MYKDKDLIIIGAGGHAKVVIEELINSESKFNLVGVIDKDMQHNINFVSGIPIIGDDSCLEELFSKGVKYAFIGIGMIKEYRLRNMIFNNLLSIGYDLINVISKKSIVSNSAKIGQGNAIFPGSIINANAKVADNCIINTGSIVEHDCLIGSNVHIATGAKIGGNVSVGDNCMIGLGSSIIQGISIGENSIIGAGSVVIRDIAKDSIAVGVPARVIRKR